MSPRISRDKQKVISKKAGFALQYLQISYILFLIWSFDLRKQQKKGDEKMKYTFKSEGTRDKLPFGSLICHIIDGFIDYENQFALTYGKIKALFDKPIYETENMEELFSYCISATSEDGTTVYLDVYCAGSGPAIGGLSDETSKEAAQELAAYIRQADPVDYSCKCYYMDGPSVLDVGIKNGQPFYHGEELILSEKEFKELYARLYNL